MKSQSRSSRPCRSPSMWDGFLNHIFTMQLARVRKKHYLHNFTGKRTARRNETKDIRQQQKTTKKGYQRGTTKGQETQAKNTNWKQVQRRTIIPIPESIGLSAGKMVEQRRCRPASINFYNFFINLSLFLFPGFVVCSF